MSTTSKDAVTSGLSYRRVLLKISGEALMGEQSYGIDVNVARSVAEELKAVHLLGVQVAVVVGGGNIFRGVSKSAGNMDRSSADYIGMLATVMNAVVLQDALEKIEVDTSAVGDRHTTVSGVVHSPPGCQTSRKGRVAHLCRRHVTHFHDRLSCCA